MRQKSTVTASSRRSSGGYAECGPSEVPFIEGSDGPRCTVNPCNTHLEPHTSQLPPTLTFSREFACVGSSWKVASCSLPARAGHQRVVVGLELLAQRPALAK